MAKLTVSMSAILEAVKDGEWHDFYDIAKVGGSGVTTSAMVKDGTLEVIGQSPKQWRITSAGRVALVCGRRP